MRLGTTTFSFTNEWLTRRFTLEELLGRVGDLGLGPHLEVIGFQVWRSYPRLSADERLAFLRLVEQHGLEPAALAGYADLARRRGHPMSVTEAAEVLRPQIDLARSLGFPVLRLHAGVPTGALEELVPAAERAGVVLATEVQGNQEPEGPAVTAILELRDRLETPAVALVLDFSVSMTSIPQGFVAAVQRAGMSRERVDTLTTLWRDGTPLPQLFGALAAMALPAAALVEAQSGFVRFGRQDPEAWRPVAPAVAYAHAKFWEPALDGCDPTVRTADHLAVLGEEGFDGVVATEWGGNAWFDVGDVDAFDVVARHRSYCHTVISNGVPEVSARS